MKRIEFDLDNPYKQESLIDLYKMSVVHDEISSEKRICILTFIDPLNLHIAISDPSPQVREHVARRIGIEKISKFFDDVDETVRAQVIERLFEHMCVNGCELHNRFYTYLEDYSESVSIHALRLVNNLYQKMVMNEVKWTVTERFRLIKSLPKRLIHIAAADPYQKIRLFVAKNCTINSISNLFNDNSQQIKDVIRLRLQKEDPEQIYYFGKTLKRKTTNYYLDEICYMDTSSK